MEDGVGRLDPELARHSLYILPAIQAKVKCHGKHEKISMKSA
jgi:hypothetical protein